MSPDALNSLFSLCIGFALAGALVYGPLLNAFVGTASGGVTFGPLSRPV